MAATLFAPNIWPQLVLKSDGSYFHVTSTEGRNRTHIDGFGDRSLTIRGLP